MYSTDGFRVVLNRFSQFLKLETENPDNRVGGNK